MSETVNRPTPMVFASPSRYVQGAHAIDSAGESIARLGSAALIIADDFVWKMAGERLTDSLAQAGVAHDHERFNGEASTAEIDRIARIARAAGAGRAEVVIGFGGGKTLDTAKGVAEQLQTACAILPTTASTDAPTSALSVIYTDDGAFESYRFYDRNPDLVLVDTALIAQAPPRFLASGIADALATWIEARAVERAGANNMTGGKPTILGTAIAEKCESVLFEHAIAAYRANRIGVVTPALEAVVEANTLLSGLGFESGGLAVAHAVHNGFTALHGPIHELTHGEKVAYGTMVQLILDRASSEEIDRYLELYQALELPVTLEAACLADVPDVDLRRVAETALAAPESSHNVAYELDPIDLVWAIKAVDALAKARPG